MQKKRKHYTRKHKKIWLS